MTDARFDSWTGAGIAYGYDGFGRMLTETINLYGTRSFTYAWDRAGNRTRITYPSGADFTYAYDSAGQLRGITDAEAAQPLFDFTYDGLGRLRVRTDLG